jgi:hypothetical protein
MRDAMPCHPFLSLHVMRLTILALYYPWHKRCYQDWRCRPRPAPKPCRSYGDGRVSDVHFSLATLPDKIAVTAGAKHRNEYHVALLLKKASAWHGEWESAHLKHDPRAHGHHCRPSTNCGKLSNGDKVNLCTGRMQMRQTSPDTRKVRRFSCTTHIFHKPPKSSPKCWRSIV